MHNLFPEIGDVNGARGDTPMGLLDGPSTRHHELSSCALRFGSSVVQPPDEVRGDVARAYLYMSAAYSTAFKLDSSARETFARWHELDPPSDFERERNRWIASKQGNGNPWVE